MVVLLAMDSEVINKYNTVQNMRNPQSLLEVEGNIQREIANMSSHDFCHKDL